MPSADYEIIVVDDGSEPPVEAPAAAPGALPAIRLIRQPNAGPAAARNRGARIARGRWIAFIDDDCIAHRDWAAQLVAALETHPDAIAGGQTVNGLAANLFAQTSQDLVASLYDYFARARSLHSFFSSNNLALARDAFVAIGGFDERFRHAAAEDRDLCERWSEAGHALVYVPEAQVAHFHPLTWQTFLRQHYTYGRGAALLRDIRTRRLPLEWPLYTQIFRYPLRRHGLARGTAVAALLACAQAAMLAGVIRARLLPEPADTGAPRRPARRLDRHV